MVGVKEHGMSDLTAMVRRKWWAIMGVKEQGMSYRIGYYDEEKVSRQWWVVEYWREGKNEFSFEGILGRFKSGYREQK